MGAYLRPWVTVLLGWFRGRRDLIIENAALRQQLTMYERLRPQIQDSDRLFWIWLIRLWPGWRDVVGHEYSIRPVIARGGGSEALHSGGGAQMWFWFRLWLSVTRLLPRERRDLVLENLALRHQLAVYQRSQRRPDLAAHDRRFWSTLARGWSEWRGAVGVVQPDTVVRWHRTAWRRYWTWKSRRRRSGRPRIALEVRDLIVRMARENRTWGAVRVVGELCALGIEVSASTVRVYRRQALRRPPSPNWRTFLRLHAPHIWAADFFTVQTLSFRTLYVFVLLGHQRRQIVHWNVTAHPTAPWVWRQIIEGTPWGTTPRFLIRDRDRTMAMTSCGKPGRSGSKPCSPQSTRLRRTRSRSV